MRIADLYGRGKPVYSFEFFPPKTEAAAEDLLRALADLKDALSPDFVSVTYGAGGSTRSRTLETVSRIHNELELTVMAHLACIGQTGEEIESIVSRLVADGIGNVLALRGDPPHDGFPAGQPGRTFSHATELIAFLRSRFELGIGAACYPEVHPEATSAEDDLRWAKAKVDNGADFLITQLFFCNDDYFRFVDRARAAGIAVPIVPGLMPITNVAQVERFTKLCGAAIPQRLRDRLERHRDEPAIVMAAGIEHAITQCRKLLDGGVPGLHFYTLNKSHATRSILAAIKGL